MKTLDFVTGSITVENSPNPSRVYIKLCKHRKKVFYCFYKTTSSKNYIAGKYFQKKFILLIKTYSPTTLIWQRDFSTDQSKLTFLKSGGGVFTTRVSLRHTTMSTYSHANTPPGQSERAIFYILQQSSQLKFFQPRFQGPISTSSRERTLGTRLKFFVLFFQLFTFTSVNNC